MLSGHKLLEIHLPALALLFVLRSHSQLIRHTGQIQLFPLFIFQDITIKRTVCGFFGAHRFSEGPLIIDQRPNGSFHRLHIRFLCPLRQRHENIGKYQVVIRHRQFLSIRYPLQIFIEQGIKTIPVLFFHPSVQNLFQRRTPYILKLRAGSIFQNPASVDFQSASRISFRQIPVSRPHSLNMFGRFRRHGILTDERAAVFHLHLGTDGIFCRPVVGIFCVFYIRLRPDNHQIGIRKNRKQPVLNQSVKGLFLVKQKHPVPVKISQIIIQFPLLRQPLVGIYRRHKLIIRVGIIKRIFLQPAFLKHLLQPAPYKRAYPASVRIVFDAGKICSQMVFHAAGKIFQTQPVFDGDDNSAAFFQMPLHHPQPVHVRVLCANITLPIFKHADKANIIKIIRQIRLHIFEISQMYCHIPAILMAVCIDQAPLFRQFDASDAPRLPRQFSSNGSAAAADLQHFCAFIHRKPVHDILP